MAYNIVGAGKSSTASQRTVRGVAKAARWCVAARCILGLQEARGSQRTDVMHSPAARNTRHVNRNVMYVRLVVKPNREIAAGTVP
jgi:hypothetical protein